MGNSVFKKIHTCSIPSENIRDNKLVYALWMGEDLSDLERISINSYLHNDHNVILYIYRNIQNIPDGVDIRDANEIVPYSDFEVIIDDICEKGVAKEYVPPDKVVYVAYSIYSDLFRYKLMYKTGGWWSDLDAICLKHYDFGDPYIFCAFPSILYTYAAGIFKVPAKSELMSLCGRDIKILYKHEHFCDKTGPFLISKAIKTLKLDVFGVNYRYFFPFDQNEIEGLIDGSELPEDCYSVHFFNSTFDIRYGKRNKFKENSIFEKLRKKYL